jgi:cbb3-type cytochrome oxidase subunit 1
LPARRAFAPEGFALKGPGLLFFASGAVYGLAGMLLGIRMGIAQDFTLAPAHAHLNLIGFVTMALMGVYYHLTPRAADAILARVHFGLATLGVWTMVPGIALAVTGRGEMLAIVGSLATIAAMVAFLVNLGLALRRPALPAGQPA